VLVVEADPALRELLSTILIEDGYQVLQIQRSTDALRIAQEHQPDAILLGLGPAYQCGLELLEQMRGGTTTRAIPVVAMTTERPDVLLACQPRLDGVLSKPFDLETMLEHIARVVRSPSAPRAVSTQLRSYFEDRWSGRIYSLGELARLIESAGCARIQVPRRFRVLPETSCRLIQEAERIAALADRDHDRRAV
jgi:DNA-binding response OmpR family regulator